jgi:hypothetical protein
MAPMSEAPSTTESPAEITGGCLCGAVKFEARTPALFSCHCHCAWCRRAHGAAFVTWLGVRESSFALVGTSVTALVWYASSEKSDRGFCRTCGTTLFFRSSLAPGEVHLALACVDQADAHPPTVHVFYESHVPWVTLGDDLPKIDRDAPGLKKYQVISRTPS